MNCAARPGFASRRQGVSSGGVSTTLDFRKTSGCRNSVCAWSLQPAKGGGNLVKRQDGYPRGAQPCHIHAANRLKMLRLLPRIGGEGALRQRRSRCNES